MTAPAILGFPPLTSESTADTMGFDTLAQTGIHCLWLCLCRPQRLPALHGAAAALQAGVPSVPSSLPRRCHGAALYSGLLELDCLT